MTSSALSPKISMQDDGGNERKGEFAANAKAEGKRGSPWIQHCAAGRNRDRGWNTVYSRPILMEGRVSKNGRVSKMEPWWSTKES